MEGKGGGGVKKGSFVRQRKHAPGGVKRTYFLCLHGAHDNGTLFRFLTTRYWLSGEFPVDDPVEGGVGDISSVFVPVFFFLAPGRGCVGAWVMRWLVPVWCVFLWRKGVAEGVGVGGCALDAMRYDAMRFSSIFLLVLCARGGEMLGVAVGGAVGARQMRYVSSVSLLSSSPSVPACQRH